MLGRLLKWCCLWSKEDEKLAEDLDHGIIGRDPVWQFELSQGERDHLLLVIETYEHWSVTVCPELPNLGPAIRLEGILKAPARYERLVFDNDPEQR